MPYQEGTLYNTKQPSESTKLNDPFIFDAINFYINIAGLALIPSQTTVSFTVTDWFTFNWRPLKWTELMKPISILLFCNIYNKHIRLVSKAFGQREGGEIEIKLTHWKVYLLENPIIIRIYTHAYAIFGPAVSPDFVRSGESKPKAIYRQAKNSALKWGQENLCAAGFFLICLILHIKKWSKKIRQ